jgi:hypothetical protein
MAALLVPSTVTRKHPISDGFFGFSEWFHHLGRLHPLLVIQLASSFVRARPPCSHVPSIIPQTNLIGWTGKPTERESNRNLHELLFQGLCPPSQFLSLMR